ncbi:transmembrane protease serine 12-like isoform X2 [Argonauta hians]
MLTSVLLVTIFLLGNGAEAFFSHHRHIMGGVKAKHCEFPWMVSLLIVKHGRYSLCSGTIINDLQILTAAHCTKDADKIIVSAGSSNRRAMNRYSFIMKPNIHSHPGYKGAPDFKNDIAILDLAAPLGHGHCVKPLAVASKNDTVSDRCIIAGWGVTKHHKYGTTLLETAKVKLFSQEKCKQHFSLISEQQVCAGSGVKNGPESCRGDSGGPLMCHVDSSNELVLVGVTSYGNYRCNTGYTVYSNVIYFNDWINNMNYAY